MNISRLLPFLPLLMLTGAAPLIPSSAGQLGLNPSDLCPLVQIVDRELCDSAYNDPFRTAYASKLSDLCVLLHNYNASFCSEQVVMDEPLQYDNLSIRVLENEFHDIRELCPILNFIDQELCTSHPPINASNFQSYTKDIIELLNEFNNNIPKLVAVYIYYESTIVLMALCWIWIWSNK